jgi:hypothetical protein
MSITKCRYVKEAALPGSEIDKLVTAMGGAQEVVDRINTLIDILEAQPQRPLTPRIIRDWSRREFPVPWRIWMLIAAMDMGLPRETVVALCPDLMPALSVARYFACRRAWSMQSSIGLDVGHHAG